MVMFTGGPGSNKSALCGKAVRGAPGWVSLSVGRLLRALAEASDTAASDDHQDVRKSISAGDFVPQVLDTLLWKTWNLVKLEIYDRNC